MSASTSANLLAALRSGAFPSLEDIREFGNSNPGEFFRDVIEPLADSFDPAQVDAYEYAMRAWIPPRPVAAPTIPARVDNVYVLSRVTLGADIKIVSPMLAAMRQRFQKARVSFVGNRKSAELFAAESGITHIDADYPRSGSIESRLDFARELGEHIAGPNSLVIDPDSRITQLGLHPVGAPAFHFPSRTAEGADNLSDLVADWLNTTFGVTAPAWIAPRPAEIGERLGWTAAISLGVGENDSKRIPGDFESRLIRLLGSRYETIWVDRGVGGDEARRVTAAVEESGAIERVRYWEGSFAGFASIIARSDLYIGYDSAGQHAAAASGIPLISIFAGAPSERFRARWTPSGPGQINCIPADDLSADEILARIDGLLPLD